MAQRDHSREPPLVNVTATAAKSLVLLVQQCSVQLADAKLTARVLFGTEFPFVDGSEAFDVSQMLDVGAELDECQTLARRCCDSARMGLQVLRQRPCPRI